MEFRKKIQLRVYLAVAYIAIGVILMVINFMGIAKNDVVASFGAVFAVMGIAKLIQNKRITRTEQSLKQREIVETDERNVEIWTKARSLAFTVYIMCTALAVIILTIMNYNEIAQILAYAVFGFVLIYWICYAIISKKY